MLFRLATRISRSPLDAPLRWVADKLQRYVDIADNYNNCDLASNGEGHLVDAGAPHWRLALDLGANQGDWALSVTARNPACVVHCFEPSPITAKRCQAALAGRSTVTVHNVGVGDRDATLAFYDYGDGSVLSSFVSREGSVRMKPERVVDVPVVTLDAWLDAQGIDRVDFCKIDTEGYEMPILRGARRALQSRRIGCVQFEYGGTWLDAGEALRSAVALFDELGWSVFRLLPDGLAPLHYDHRTDEHFKYANFVATPDRAELERWGVRVR